MYAILSKTVIPTCPGQLHVSNMFPNDKDFQRVTDGKEQKGNNMSVKDTEVSTGKTHTTNEKDDIGKPRWSLYILNKRFSVATVIGIIW